MLQGHGIRRASVLPAAAAAAAAALVVCAAWRPLLLEGQIPLDGNMIAHSYPNWSVLRALCAESLLPAWNPWRSMGEPFLADPQTMSLHPAMRLLALVPDFGGFLRAWIVLHTLLAAAFLAALAWRLHGSRAAAAAAAALGGLNGFFIAHAIFPNTFASAAWLPAVLYFQHGLSPLGLGASLAFQWLSGFPPFSILTVAAAAAVAAAQGRKGIKCFLQGCAWAAGLAAAQWIPFLELMGKSARAFILDASRAQEYSLPPLQLLKEAFLPQWSRWSPSVEGDPAVVCFYVGLGAWVLAARALWTGGRRERLLAAGCAAAMLLSLGGRLPGLSLVPLLRIFRFPANWLLLASAAAALLGASGVASLRGAAARWTAVGVVVADLLAFALVPRTAWSRPEFLSEAPVLASELSRTPAGSRVYHSEELRRVWESGTLETEEDYLLMRDYLAPSFGAAFGVAEASSYQTLRLAAADRYLRRMSLEGPSSPLADFAGIDRIVALRPGAARVTRGAIGVIRRPSARARIFLEEGSGAVRIASYRPGFAEARVEAAGAARLVLAEMDYPGWRASVDGRPAEVAVFAGAFPSVRVSPGTHDVVFSFRSTTALIGALLSAATLAAFLVSLRRR